MMDALSTIETVNLWLDLRDAGSPEAEDFRQALLRRLKMADGQDALPVVRLAWGANATAFDERVEQVGNAAYAAHRRWVEAYLDKLKGGVPDAVEVGND
jgi:hypothetical protein